MPSMTSTLGGLCTPAQLYLALSVIAVIFVAINSFSISTIVIKLLFIALWTFILNWICSKGYTTISWILVILPYVIFILMFLVALDVSSANTKNQVMNERQNAVPYIPTTIRQGDNHNL